MPATTPSRNDPCPCGSGRKFKKCCGIPQTAAPDLPSRTWHDLDDRLGKDLTAFGLRHFGERWAHVIDDYPVEEEAFEEEEQHFNLFIQWACHEWKFDGKPLAAHYLEARGRNLLGRERDWLEAHGRSWLSIWEVTAVEPGAWIDLQDWLTGERRRVMEAEGSRSLHKRLVLLGRVVDHAGLSLLCGSHPNPLSPSDADRVMKGLRESAGQHWPKVLTPAQLRSETVATALIGLWEEEVVGTSIFEAPRLTTSDGEDLVMVKDTFALVGAGARDEMTRRLTAQPDVDPPDRPRDAFVFEGPIDHTGESSVLGEVTMTNRELRLETNSRERADRLRQRIEALGDRLLRHKTRVEEDLTALVGEVEPPARGKGPAPSQASEGPEMEAAIQSFKSGHYATWADHPLPALDGLSPRDAAQIPALRARLALLLKDMEEQEHRMPANQRFDFGTIWRDLGLKE